MCLIGYAIARHTMWVKKIGHFEFFAKVFHLRWQERRRGLLHWGRVVEDEEGRLHRDGFAHWSFSNFLLILQRYHNLIALV